MKVIWSSDAVRDLEAIRDYIAESNPVAAKETARHIVDALETLVEFPGMGRPGRLPHTRELVVSGTPFIVPYRVTEKGVEIAAIIHGARKWPDV
ncbi:MAG: type II toxin-antitoxin system RelE/ParE family toxin [Kiloniellales bacterium]|nr:type II toxin-antitoxin system RelE/ParE family toxin [Kiloniellales bacterium]